MKNAAFALIALVLLNACSVQHRLSRHIPLNSTHFQGLLFVDLDTGDTLYQKNADVRFVPASTTKMFTLYASLAEVSDSLTAFKYKTSSDTLFVKSTSDPTFLNPHFEQGKVFEMLKDYPVIAISPGYSGSHYGKGWMWDDARDSYQTEISAFPVFGNLATVISSDGVRMEPVSVEKLYMMENASHSVFRWNDNEDIAASLQSGDTLRVPFNTDMELVCALLKDTLHREVISLPGGSQSFNRELKSIAKDTVLKYMMYHSDNMLADHMLLQAGLNQFSEDQYDQQKIISYFLENRLADLPQKPRWVDGSGLSRYNLFSPSDLVFVVNKIRREFGEEAIRTYFPHNGTSGTMETFLKGEETFLYAKSGSMSGVYNLAGILETKNGRKLIFAVMNNNFTRSVGEVRSETAALLSKVRDTF